MGYQAGDDGVPGRGRVTTLTSHQSEILHSLIFVSCGQSGHKNRAFFSN